MLSTVLTLFVSASMAAIPLNSASVEQLAAINGVDTNTAEKIVDLRAGRGQLTNVESLRVLQLSEQTLQAIRKNVVVNLQLPLNITQGSKKKKQYTSTKQVLREFDNEPNVRAVQSMAMSYSRTNPELVKGWLTSVKRAFALPKVNLQYEKEIDYATRYEYVQTEDANTRQEDYLQAEDDDKVVVKLEWRLDKLVMSSEKIRVINEAQKAVKLREKLLDEVTRLYFDRRRLQVEMILKPKGSLREQIETELRLQEMTANLDALTGGAFSASLNR